VLDSWALRFATNRTADIVRVRRAIAAAERQNEVDMPTITELKASWVHSSMAHVPEHPGQLPKLAAHCVDSASRERRSTEERAITLMPEAITG
jgi:hypothetical protein